LTAARAERIQTDSRELVGRGSTIDDCAALIRIPVGSMNFPNHVRATPSETTTEESVRADSVLLLQPVVAALITAMVFAGVYLAASMPPLLMPCPSASSGQSRRLPQ
jgi:hypothetical protein